MASYIRSIYSYVVVDNLWLSVEWYAYMLWLTLNIPYTC